MEVYVVLLVLSFFEVFNGLRARALTTVIAGRGAWQRL